MEALLVLIGFIVLSVTSFYKGYLCGQNDAYKNLVKAKVRRK